MVFFSRLPRSRLESLAFAVLTCFLLVGMVASTQWVDKPTKGNNTLDFVFSSEDNMISKLSVGEKLGKSDHNMIRFEILTSFTKLEKSFMKPNFRKADFSRLRCEIRRLPKRGGTDSEQNWFSFKTRVYETSAFLKEK